MKKSAFFLAFLLATANVLAESELPVSHDVTMAGGTYVDFSAVPDDPSYVTACVLTPAQVAAQWPDWDSVGQNCNGISGAFLSNGDFLSYFSGHTLASAGQQCVPNLYLYTGYDGARYNTYPTRVNLIHCTDDVWTTGTLIYHKERIATYGYQAVAADHDITDGGIGMLYQPTTDKPVQAIESVSFYMWRNASSSSDLEAKVYNMETDPPVLMATSATVAGSTVVLNENYDPLTGTEGGWVKFTFATPVVLKGGDDYAIVVHNNDLEDYHLIGTATGSGYSTKNDCRYISDDSPFTLTACSGSNESVNVRLEFTPVVLGSPLDDAPWINNGAHFGDNWVRRCPDDTGPWKLHTGSDFTTGGEHGATVYATEAGDVVNVITSSVGWAKGVVIEHVHPSGWHYTTVTWHIDTTLTVTNPLTTVEKGDPIGTIANINVSPYFYTPHLHFGVQMGAIASGYGSLPVNECEQDSTTYPAFPNGFIDTNDTDYVQYQ